MFVVELERGPSGLGMGLVDGMVSELPRHFLQAPRLLFFPRDGPTAGVVTGRRWAEAHGPGDQGLVGASQQLLPPPAPSGLMASVLGLRGL